jgi:UDP:flavonoid glycosyltransferase YjiC (YdhE family)
MEKTGQYPNRKPRVMFWGEDLALSHVVRPLMLAKAVRDQYDTLFVTGDRYTQLVESYNITPHKTWTLSNEIFMQRLSHGLDGWLDSEISRQVDDELALINELSPDLVVGDLRWSLGISCELTQTPYISLVDAYWGPYCTLPPPTPEFPFVNVLGVKLSSWLMPMLAPVIFKQLAKPFDRVRVERGLPACNDYRKIATHADWVIYPNIPSLAPTADLPDNHRYLGPLLWSMETEYPAWWDQVPDNKPLIYVTMGSTGRVGVIDKLIEALEALPVTVMLATSERISDKKYPSNFYVSDYLPGLEACKRSDLVICNGGAGAVYQAIAGKTPVLGIPTNADQYYVINALESQGGGLSIRSTHVSKNKIIQAVEKLLADDGFVESIGELNDAFLLFNEAQVFSDLVDAALSQERSNS